MPSGQPGPLPNPDVSAQVDPLIGANSTDTILGNHLSGGNIAGIIVGSLLGASVLVLVLGVLVTSVIYVVYKKKHAAEKFKGMVVLEDEVDDIEASRAFTINSVETQ